MVLSIKHKFTSPKADGVDSTVVQPSNWNADHDILLASGKVLGRMAATDGAAQELPLAVDPTGQSLIPPIGTTAQRPAAPVQGMLRFNTTTDFLELYTGSVWQDITPSSVRTTAPTTPVLGQFWLNTSDGSVSIWNGTAWAALGIADNTVSTNKLVNLAVTAAKIADATITWAKLAAAAIASQAEATAGTENAKVVTPLRVRQALEAAAYSLSGPVQQAAPSVNAVTSGTHTPSLTGGNMKDITNGGAFTLAAPADGWYTMLLKITNISGAGAVATSGFTKVVGDAFTTTVGHVFAVHISVMGSVKMATVQAAQ